MAKDRFNFVDKSGIVAASISNKSGLNISFLQNGSVFSITKENILISQLMANPLESSLGNIYLRVLGSKISYVPLTGPLSNSKFSVSEKNRSALWQGENFGLQYSCKLDLALDNDLWFWTVDVKNNNSKALAVDVIFAQDLGLGSFGMVRSNEAYTSQYIDHEPLKHPKFGFVMASRQGQKQDKGFPWALNGCLNGAVGYLTDGFQFFGLSYKESGVPEALIKEKLLSQRMQYEFALPTLQSKKIILAPGKSLKQIFFTMYQDDHAKANNKSDLSFATKAQSLYKKTVQSTSVVLNEISGSASMFSTAKLLKSISLTPAEITKYVGSSRRHEEKGHSFFCDSNTHVVLKAKELVTERPHGHIMRSGSNIMPSDDTLATTSWAYGVFNSHVMIGNTNFNKVLSFQRNALNLHRSCGQRIFVKTNKGYELLGVPSLYEIGLNNSRWIYKNAKGEIIIVKAWASIDNPACFLEIESSAAKEFLITNGIVLGNNDLEHSGSIIIDKENAVVECVPAKSGLLYDYYPQTKFFIISKDKKSVANIGGDELLYSDGIRRNGAFISFSTKLVKNFSITITGNVQSAKKADLFVKKYSSAIENYEVAKKSADIFWSNLQKGIILKHKDEGVSKLNDIIPWYVHNAMIHFTSPHGLEQYSGAAWGLRDVCQGPTEFLCATQNYKEQRETVKMVFANQFIGSGDWPQWFMYDRYGKIRSCDSHGDIIMWPLKALCEYIEATNDFSILNEKVCYVDDKTCAPISKIETISEHVAREIAVIKAGCVNGTALYHYGHGDWEDTLQPADPDMREHMVSSWTVELCYQTLLRYEKVNRRMANAKLANELNEFCVKIKTDFNKYLVKDGVVAGLVFFKGKTPQYMLHPKDNKTGVHYRLLPMTRGMTSNMFTPAQAKSHYEIVKKHLLFPDGVRLVNKPIPYKGGVEVYFKRAESASNFGREIGMQYVHAHIRYIEAMCALGKADEAYTGLLTICPITLQKVFKTSLPRQNNAYFSSSDAAFADRYEAVKKFDDIKKLKVGIKGGWRIYSSGPGIYLNQLISNFIGIRSMYENILIDPVLPKKLDGFEFYMCQNGKGVTYKYHITKKTTSPYKIIVNTKEAPIVGYTQNPYRAGGALVNKKVFETMLNLKENTVHVYL